jgi:membrane protein YqaA with SNARE-associated domain
LNHVSSCWSAINDHRHLNKNLHRLVEIWDRSALHRLVRPLGALAGRPWFPLLGAVTAFGATISMTVPTVPILGALVSLNPRRWVAIACWAVLGSAAAGALLVHVLGHFGGILLAEKVPELAASSHWRHMAGLASHHGWWILILVAALPVSQTPFLVVAALFGMPVLTVFLSLFAGKALKYGAVAGLTARAMSELAAHSGGLPEPISKVPS